MAKIKEKCVCRCKGQLLQSKAILNKYEQIIKITVELLDLTNEKYGKLFLITTTYFSTIFIIMYIYLWFLYIRIMYYIYFMVIMIIYNYLFNNFYLQLDFKQFIFHWTLELSLGRGTGFKSLPDIWLAWSLSWFYWTTPCTSTLPRLNFLPPSSYLFIY